MIRRIMLSAVATMASAVFLAAPPAWAGPCANLPAPNSVAGKAYFSHSSAAAWGTISSTVPTIATAGTNFYVDVQEYIFGKGPSRLLVTLISPKGPIKQTESVKVSKAYVRSHTGTKVFLVADPGTAFVSESPVLIDGRGCGYSVVGNSATTGVVSKVKGVADQLPAKSVGAKTHPSTTLKALAAVAALVAAAGVGVMMLRARRAA